MPRIINGEIVPDNDPRVRQQAQRSSSSSGAAGSRFGSVHSGSSDAANSGNTNFGSSSATWSRKPAGAGSGGGRGGVGGAQTPEDAERERMRQASFLGLPNFTLLGVELVPQVYLFAAAALYLGGPNAIILLAVVFFLYRYKLQKEGRLVQ